MRYPFSFPNVAPIAPDIIAVEIDPTNTSVMKNSKFNVLEEYIKKFILKESKNPIGRAAKKPLLKLDIFSILSNIKLNINA